MIDIGRFEEAALYSARQLIKEAASTARPFGEGTTTDKALWSEIRAETSKRFAAYIDFMPERIVSYFTQFPEMATYATLPGATIADAVAAALPEALFDRATTPRLIAMHESQYDRMHVADVRVWSEAAIYLARRVATVPQAITIKKNLSLLESADDISRELYQAVEELSRMANQPHIWPEFRVLGRRLKESLEFLKINMDRTMDNVESPEPVDVAPAPRKMGR